MNYREMEECRSSLKSALQHEISWRKFKQPADWILGERLAVMNAANRWAMTHPPMRPVTIAQVEEVERSAVGHSDYVDKYVLRVSHLLYKDQISI